MITTTLKEIRSKSPCEDGWKTLLEHLGKSGAEAKEDETPLPVMTVLNSNGMDDAIWVLANCINPHICRLFAADCAERVLHFFEDERPDDTRPRDAIAVARNPEATRKERAAAGAAARAAWNAAVTAAGTAAGAAARLARAAAARAAADAARSAAWDAAWDAAGAAQEKRLRQYLEHGEAAQHMEWPE